MQQNNTPDHEILPGWVPVSAVRHARKFWRPPADFAFARGFRQVPVVLGEHEAIAANLPLVFDGAGAALALLRLNVRGAGAMVSPAGIWRGSYVPVLLRLYPFGFGLDADGMGQLLVDEASGLVHDGAAACARSRPFLRANGVLDPVLAELLAEFQARAAAETATRAAARALCRAGVLRAFGRDHPLAGFHGIDRAALDATARAEIAQLHRSGALALAQAHFVSLSHLVLLERAEAAVAGARPVCGLGAGRAASMPDSDLRAFIAALDADQARPAMSY